MRCSNQNTTGHRRRGSWGRFVVCVVAFIGVIFFFTKGATPPGAFGTVVRHNQAKAIDATPYFYSEVENIIELQAALDEWWKKPDSTHSPNKSTDSGP